MKALKITFITLIILIISALTCSAELLEQAGKNAVEPLILTLKGYYSTVEPADISLNKQKRVLVTSKANG